MRTRQSGGIHHIDVNVSDLRAARRVYGLLLEFLGYQRVRDDPDACEWDLATDDGLISFGLRRAHDDWVSHVHRRYAPGLHHLAWRAGSRTDVDAFHEHLIANGIPILDSPAEYPQYSESYYALFFEDPDGMKLELLHED